MLKLIDEAMIYKKFERILKRIEKSLSHFFLIFTITRNYNNAINMIISPTICKIFKAQLGHFPHPNEPDL